jgi:hypothetical protein
MFAYDISLPKDDNKWYFLVFRLAHGSILYSWPYEEALQALAVIRIYNAWYITFSPISGSYIYTRTRRGVFATLSPYVRVYMVH